MRFRNACGVRETSADVWEFRAIMFWQQVAGLHSLIARPVSLHENHSMVSHAPFLRIGSRLTRSPERKIVMSFVAAWVTLPSTLIRRYLAPIQTGASCLAEYCSHSSHPAGRILPVRPCCCIFPKDLRGGVAVWTPAPLMKRRVMPVSH